MSPEQYKTKPNNFGKKSDIKNVNILNAFIFPTTKYSVYGIRLGTKIWIKIGELILKPPKLSLPNNLIKFYITI